MKKKTVGFVFLLLAGNAAFAWDTCEEKAEMAVELREDYKNLAEVQVDINKVSANLSVLRSLGGNTVDSEYRLKLKRLLALEVFQIHGGAKGAELHKQVRDSCVALEKADAERRSKQAARAADKALRDASSPSSREIGNAIRNNIFISQGTVFSQEITGTPRAEFAVSLSSACNVIAVRLKSSSGNKKWDEAVERAILKTDPFPTPSSGKCPSSMVIVHTLDR